MQSAHLLWFISGVLHVHAEIVTISVKKTVTVEATVTLNGTVTTEQLSNFVTELTKEVCLSGDECQRAEVSSQNETTLPSYHQSTESSWSASTFSPEIESNETNVVPTTVVYHRVPLDCSELPPLSPSGVYNLSNWRGQLEVFCDMDTDGGNWTVIQSNNISSPHNMDKSWLEYEVGFGIPEEVFWLGNLQLSYLTKRQPYHLRVDMIDTEGNSMFAKYSYFKVHDQSTKYRLFVGAGTAGHGLMNQDGRNFSTFDMRSDSGMPCPEQLRSGWWWNKECEGVDLNSYKPRWMDTQLRSTQMKIRPKNIRYRPYRV